jgi:hypothetical protein
MDFPDFDSLKQRAKGSKYFEPSQRNFRQPHEGETEAQFRVAFADHMKPIDSVEASEIRCGSGWDKMNGQQTMDMLADKVGGHGKLLKLLLDTDIIIDELIEGDDDERSD